MGAGPVSSPCCVNGTKRFLLPRAQSQALLEAPEPTSLREKGPLLRHAQRRGARAPGETRAQAPRQAEPALRPQRTHGWSHARRHVWPRAHPLVGNVPHS